MNHNNNKPDMQEYVYQIVEAWGAMAYYLPGSDELLYRETEDMRQCYWVVLYHPEEHDIIDWIEMFPTEEQAQEYKEKLDKGEK